MKKIVLVIVAAISLLSLSSCSKSCNCKGWGSYGSNGIERTWTETPPDGKKCSDYNTSVEALGISSGIKCTQAMF